MNSSLSRSWDANFVSLSKELGHIHKPDLLCLGLASSIYERCLDGYFAEQFLLDFSGCKGLPNTLIRMVSHNSVMHKVSIRFFPTLRNNVSKLAGWGYLCRLTQSLHRVSPSDLFAALQQKPQRRIQENISRQLQWKAESIFIMSVCSLLLQSLFIKVLQTHDSGEYG